MTAQNNLAGPLAGIRVLELCHVVAGPYASMYLAMLGAEVIKIENPKTQGDLCRQSGPHVEQESLRFCALNHNKQSITLDLSQEEGKELFLRLVQKSDIVMDNFRPDVLNRLGIGYDAMKQANPKIIYGNISGFGTYGPYKDYPAFDMIAQALSGVMFLNGEAHMPPIKIGTSIADVLAGVHLVIGLLSALHRVKETGEGCFVETALVDSLVSALMMEHVNYFYNQTIPPRIGNDYREWCPAGVFESKDGWFVLASGHEKDFRALAQCIGQTEWLTDESLRSHAARVKQRDEINAVLNAWGRNRTTEEACQQLRQADIPCAPVYDLPDVVADSHIADTRNMFPQYMQPGIGLLTATNIPLRFHDMPPVPLSPAPKLGQDTASVLRELLSLSDSELERLQRNSVCG